MKYVVLSIFLCMSGCSVKEYKLFQDENPEHSESIQDLNISYSSKILVDDILKIDIYNLNQKLTSFISTDGGTDNSASEHIVSENGEIFLPLLGDIKVEGLTVKKLNTLLNEKYKKYLNKPYVKSKIKNHKVYVLGEVPTQGVIPIEGNSISIIEIISKSGGLSDYAIKHRIHVISENQGKYQVRTLDLTKLATLNTHNLMVKHSSIVYVEPKNSKAIQVSISEYLPLITSVLGTFLAIDLVKGN